jgi:hypothetical protein
MSAFMARVLRFEIEQMSVLFGQIVFPAIFLIVATLNPRNMIMKGVCIILAYFTVISLQGGIYAAPVADNGMMENTSPFGLLLLGISLWGFVLMGSGAIKAREKDNS